MERNNDIKVHISKKKNNITIPVNVNCQFFFQRELQQVAHLWNCHRIRPSRNAVSPSGRPLIMYSFPHLFGTTNYLKTVFHQQIRGMPAERPTSMWWDCFWHLLPSNVRKQSTPTYYSRRSNWALPIFTSLHPYSAVIASRPLLL